jgi:hypothetical protein
MSERKDTVKTLYEPETALFLLMNSALEHQRTTDPKLAEAYIGSLFEAIVPVLPEAVASRFFEACTRASNGQPPFDEAKTLGRIH